MSTLSLAIDSAAFVELVNERIQQLVMSGNDPVHEVVSHLFNAGGKRIRPTLVLASASFKPFDQKVLIDVASAIELVHMASLIHDDIIDESSTRRGSDTINYKWNNLTAVLAGDYLFASAFNLLTTTKNHQVLESLTNSIRLMCEGEINQSAQTFNCQQSEADYFNNIYKKTACLFCTSCQAGALTAGLPWEQIRLIEKFGLYLGYAYQILDDILDLVATPCELGKPVGNDLLHGILTLPVLRLLQDEQYGPELKQMLANRQITSEEVIKIVDCLYRRSDGLKYALNRFNQMLNNAQAVLQDLPAVPARTAIQEMSAQLFAKPLELAQHGLEPLEIRIANLFDHLSDLQSQDKQLDLFPAADWLPKLLNHSPGQTSIGLQENYA